MIKKTSITKYKNYFSYNTLYSFLKYKTNILDSIKENQIINYKKLNDSIISNIYKIIPKDFINKIENLDKKNLLDELSEEKEWKYKYIKYNKSDGQRLKIKFFDDFEIINDDLFNLFTNEQKIIFKNLFFGNIIFGEKKIFVSIMNTTCPIFEICHLGENGYFNVEYLFNQKDISDSNIFIEYLLNIGIDQLLITINVNKEINFNNKNIKCYKVDKSQIKENNTKLQQNKDNNNDKLKTLILLLIYEYKNKLEEVYLIDKKYLDTVYLNDIYKLINEDDNIINIVKNNHEYAFEFIDKIIKNLDYNDLVKINNKIYKNSLNNKEYKVNIEKIKFYNSKKNIYKDFFLVSKKIYNYLQKNFQMQLNDYQIYFISINNKGILIDNSQSIIFIGYLDKKQYSYNFNLILDFQNKNDFNDELKILIKIGFEKYFFKRLFFNEGIKIDYISPIYSNERIIGYAYRYIPTIKEYNKFKLIDYKSYISNETLKNNISLYSY